jgi:hypothetical protein
LAGLVVLHLGGLLPVDDAEDRAVHWHQAVCYLAQLPVLSHFEIQPPDVLSRTEMLQLTLLTRLDWLHVNPYQKTEQLLFKEVNVWCRSCWACTCS